MKTILFLCLLGIASAFILHSSPLLETDCSKCNGTLCQCGVTCGEGTVLKCNCGSLTCSCWCESTTQSNLVYYQLPGMDDRQEANMKDAEQYFRSQGSLLTIRLADSMAKLPGYLRSADLQRYTAEANITEGLFAKLSEQEKARWMSWSQAHLR